MLCKHVNIKCRRGDKVFFKGKTTLLSQQGVGGEEEKLFACMSDVFAKVVRENSGGRRGKIYICLICHRRVCFPLLLFFFVYTFTFKYLADVLVVILQAPRYWGGGLGGF